MQVTSDRFPFREQMDIDSENINIYNKRPQEESLRPKRADAGDVTKKPKIQKHVRFAEEVADPGCGGLVNVLAAIALELPYHLYQSPRELGWVVTTPDYERFAIHSKASRYMPDADFIFFARDYPHFTHLQFSDGLKVTDDGFIAVLKGRSHMQLIEISLCPNITSKTLYAIGSFCPQLRECSLLECPNVDDRGVFALVTQCKNLRVLNLDWCHGLTDESLFAIARNCPLLAGLSLNEATQFSLKALRSVLQGCQWLEKLDLWSCTQVTDAWIDTIIEWGRNIKELDLKYCDKITPQAIKRLKTRFRFLKLNH